MKKNNVGADPVSDHRKNKGITLIALIITIIVMLILVIVSVQIALNTGLFETAGKATKNWEEAQESEAGLGAGKITIGGVTYDSIEEYTNLVSGGKQEVDFEKLFETAQKHPEQIMTNDIGIAEDGSIVNLDLWIYVKTGENDGWKLLGDGYEGDSSYDQSQIIDGKIIGQIPMFIKQYQEETYYPVTEMYETFAYCETLTEVPKIPSSVTNMFYAFFRCTSLTKAPEIPNSVTDMSWTFYACTSLTEAPSIPSSVTEMKGTFNGCESLQGTIVINSLNITDIGEYGSYYEIFKNMPNNVTVKVPANSTTYETFNALYGTSSNITIETF